MNRAAETPVELEFAGPVATLTLNRPQVRNALDRALVERFAECVEAISARNATRVVVLQGRGAGFSAGADLSELASVGLDEVGAVEARTAEVFDRLAALPVISVAAAHGFALGGGFLMTLYCDWRIFAHGTRIGFPPAARSWVPPWALSRLASWIGPRRAQQVLLTQSLFGCDEAARWGLADEQVEPAALAATAQARAARLADTDRSVIAEIRTFFAALDGYEHARWDALARSGFSRRFSSPEAQAAMGQFLNRGGRHRADVTKPS